MSDSLPSAISDAELLRRWIEEKDCRAADQLIRRHEQSLYAFSVKLSKNGDEASEIVQESFLRMLQSAQHFQGGSSVRTWIFGIAVNVSRANRFRFRRVRKLFRPLEGNEEIMSKLDPARERSLQSIATLDEAVASLPKSSRVPILLHYYQGFSYEEMSEVLGCSPGTVASRLSTARKRLEKKLKKSGVELSALALIGPLSNLPQPSLPSSLVAQLRQLPQQAISSAPLAPIGIGLGKWVAGIVAVVSLSAGTVYWVEHSQRQNAPVILPTEHGPIVTSKRPYVEPFFVEPFSCEEWSAVATHERYPALSGSGSKEKQEAGPSSLSLVVEGFVKDANSGDLMPGKTVELKSIWPKRMDGESEWSRIVQSNEAGFYRTEISGLRPGLYELSVLPSSADSVISPLLLDLRESKALTHHFDYIRKEKASDRDGVLQPYREELMQVLSARWEEAGMSSLRLQFMTELDASVEAALFSQDKQSLGPAVQVFEPVHGELLLGPVMEETLRLELVAMGQAIYLLPEITVPKNTRLLLPLSLQEQGGSVHQISLEVLSKNGEPLAGARVEVMPSSFWSHLPFAAAHTDNRGRVCIEGLPEQVWKWNLRVTAPGESQSGFLQPTVLCELPANGELLRVVVE